MNNKNKSNYLTELKDVEYELRILHSLRKIIRSVDIHSRKLSINYDITAPQLITLIEVNENGEQTIASISKKIYLSSSTLVGIVDRLEAKGYLIRKRDIIDRRKILIVITDAGKKFLNEAPSPLQETLCNALKQLTILEQSTIYLSLERIVELMNAKGLDVAPILETGEIDKKK